MITSNREKGRENHMHCMQRWNQMPAKFSEHGQIKPPKKIRTSNQIKNRNEFKTSNSTHSSKSWHQDHFFLEDAYNISLNSLMAFSCRSFSSFSKSLIIRATTTASRFGAGGISNSVLCPDEEPGSFVFVLELLFWAEDVAAGVAAGVLAPTLLPDETGTDLVVAEALTWALLPAESEK